MASKTVTFTTRTETCDGVTKKYIVADPPSIVLKNKNWQVKFQNDLEADAEVQFFEISDKGDPSDVLTDFCNGMNGDDTLGIDKTKHKNCKPADDGYYAYTVVADGYEDLDPVVIIEPLAATGVLSLLSPLLVGAVGGAAVLGGQKFLGRKKAG